MTETHARTTTGTAPEETAEEMTEQTAEDPFHAGERAVQTQAGERARARALAGNMARSIPERARTFLGQQAFCLLGARDDAGAIWAALVAGQPGFTASDPAGRKLCLDLCDPADILTATPPLTDLAPGRHVGVLFVDVATRRRLRVNGHVESITEERLVITVERAYPLCPKYIQRRPIQGDSPPADTGIRQGTTLTPNVIDWITASDTFFVASAHPEGFADVSYRGGRPGFVTVANDRLTIPDYPGNGMFNTLGNFALNPRAGLSFIDFATNRQLQLTGHVHLDLAAGESDKTATGGTGRLWQFRPTQWRTAPINRGFVWAEAEASPYNP